MNKLIKRKAFVDPVGCQGTNLKDHCSSEDLRFHTGKNDRFLGIFMLFLFFCFFVLFCFVLFFFLHSRTYSILYRVQVTQKILYTVSTALH